MTFSTASLDIMRTASGFFDISDANAFFDVVSNTLNAYRASSAKTPEQLLLLVLGLTHLREWIAPDYKSDAIPKTRAEQFVSELLKHPDYVAILLLANHAKHQRRKSLPNALWTTYIETIDARDTPVDTWFNFDKGPASDYHYGDRSLEEMFANVLAFYRDHWFSLPTEQRLSEIDV